jgi:phytanoyl-CoA hydroxylase
MEQVNQENGCLIAVPGSHKGELLEHGYPDWEFVNKAYGT